MNSALKALLEKALFKSNSVPDAAIQCIADLGFVTIAEFAAGDSDSAVDAELLESAEVKALALRTIDKPRIREAWAACREEAATASAPADASSQVSSKKKFSPGQKTASTRSSSRNTATTRKGPG